MFFTPGIERKHRRILEIGPGGLPHPASDVWLDYAFDEDERRRQSGGIQPAQGKLCVFYNGVKFPFRDRAFDYVIASHVVEHVPWESLPGFIEEMQRIASAGYIELPRWPYELFFDIDEHVSTGDVLEGTLVLYKKLKRSNGAERRRAVLAEYLPMREFLCEQRHFFFCKVEWRDRILYRTEESKYPPAESPEYISSLVRAELGNSLGRSAFVERFFSERSMFKKALHKVMRSFATRKTLSFDDLYAILQCPRTGSAIDASLRNERGEVVFRAKGGNLYPV